MGNKNKTEREVVESLIDACQEVTDGKAIYSVHFNDTSAGTSLEDENPSLDPAIAKNLTVSKNPKPNAIVAAAEKTVRDRKNNGPS